MAAPDFIRLPLLAQTAYVRLLDLLATVEMGDLAGGASLVSKTIRGRRYWYTQRRESGRKLQSYIGPETPELTAVIERWRRVRAEEASRVELVAMARAGGAQVIGAAEADVLRRLSPVFRVGGVLIGSHAFAVIGNMLGARWQAAIVRTEDVDIAADHRIAVALARDGEAVDVREALGDPLPRFSVLSPSDPATSFRVRGAEIEVEVLTPLVGKERNRPIRIPTLGVAALPLRFLDYLIEETQPGAVLGGSGVLVNVPRPGRFALHKLIVAARRGTISSSSLAKAPKDRAQASALLRLLLAELPGEVTIAWKALARRGPAWTGAVAASLARLDPEIVSGLKGLGIAPRATRA
jgi:hypothetical protein